jgi:sec-independent protein translocase protein TatB
MFGVEWSELLIVLIVAIIVVGPKELPGLMRTAGRMLGKLRRTAEDFRRQFDEAVKEAGGEDLQREMNALRQHNPLNQIRNSIEEAARDAYTPRTGTLPESAVTAATADAGELPPPPPLPPRTDGIFSGLDTSAIGAPPAETAALPSPPLPKPITEEAPPSPPAAPLPKPLSEATPSAPPAAPAYPAKDLSGDSPSPDTRLNGEHRPVSR